MFEITNTTKRRPGVTTGLFSHIKNDILGERYDLSLVFIGNKRSQTLNKERRGKDYSTNVLSFPLDEHTGEIFINLNIISKQAKDYHLSNKSFVIFLFIHGLLHLKGFDHSEKMEKLEKLYMKKYIA